MRSFPVGGIKDPLSIATKQRIYLGNKGSEYPLPGCGDPDLKRDTEKLLLLLLKRFDDKVHLDQLRTGMAASFTPKAAPEGSLCRSNSQNVAPDKIKGIKLRRIKFGPGNREGTNT